MNIQIKHISNTFNYGSSMMAITLIDKLNKELENLKIYVDASTNKDLERLKIETNSSNLIRDNILNRNNILVRIINKLKRIWVEKSADVIIIIGGDDISEYYGVQALEKELNRLMNLSNKKTVILLGQTMGPFTEYRGELARKTLQNTKIYTRDDNCLKYLNELNFKNIHKGRDLAFVDLPNQSKAKHIINKYNLNREEYIVIVPSGLTKCYTNDYTSYISQQVDIINRLLAKHSLSDKKIVLLPHVLLPEYVDDRIVIRDIMKRLDHDIYSRIVAIDDKMLPSEAREILANGMFTITGRMHAAVSTFYMRKPAISLSYSVKYAGVIGEGLDMNELVIESSDDKLWEEGKISELVNQKIDYILDNYNDLIDKIDKNVSKTSKIVEDELESLIKELRSKK